MTNVANTVWQPNPGEGEYSSSTPVNIVDSSSVALVDSSGVNLVDGDSAFTSIPSTTWTASDGS